MQTTLLAHIHLGAHQALRVSFCKAFLTHFFSTHTRDCYTDTWGYYSQGAKLNILCLNSMRFFSAHFPSLSGPSEWETIISCTNTSSWFCIVSRLAELTLCPIIQVVNEVLEKHCSLGHSTSDWSLAVLQATDCSPLNLIFQLYLGRMVRHRYPLHLSDNSKHLCSFYVSKWFPGLFATLL